MGGVSALLRDTGPKVFPSVGPQSRDEEVSVFDVLALMLRDESLAPASTDVLESESPIASIFKTKGDTIRK